MMALQPPLLRYVGDDWTVGPITLYGSGLALNLTGCTVTAEFYVHSVQDPVASLTIANGGITLASDLTSGVIEQVKVPRALTATVPPQTRNATTFPTRAAVMVTDSQGAERTYLLILFLPLDKRSDMPPVLVP